MVRSYLHLSAGHGSRDDLLKALDTLEVLAAVRGEPGFLAAEIQLPFDDGDDVLVVGSWASREHFERWEAGPSGVRLLETMSDLLARKPETRLYHVVDAVQTA